VETVTCQICGMQRKQLRMHLQAVHGLTCDQYLETYPGNRVEITRQKRSLECRAKQAEAARKRWANPGNRKKQSETLKRKAPWKGKHLSESHKQAISEGGRGTIHRLTDSHRQFLADRGRKFLESLNGDPKIRRKRSAVAKRRFASGELFGFRKPGVFDKIMASKVANGTVVPNGSGRGICGFRKDISHYCRSTLEANFARILLHEGVLYEYEPKVFDLKGKKVVPDFYLHSSLGDVPAGWVELKGWRKADGSFPRMEPFILEALKNQGVKVFILCQHDDLWKHLEAVYSSKILWENAQNNLRANPEMFGTSVSLGG